MVLYLIGLGLYDEKDITVRRARRSQRSGSGGGQKQAAHDAPCARPPPAAAAAPPRRGSSSSAAGARPALCAPRRRSRPAPAAGALGRAANSGRRPPALTPHARPPLFSPTPTQRRGLEAVRRCARVYLEMYTSILMCSKEVLVRMAPIHSRVFPQTLSSPAPRARAAGFLAHAPAHPP